MSEFDDHTIEEKFLLDLYKTNHSKNFIFHSVQFKIYNLLMSGRNVVLSAPTSMGKSAIVDSLIASNKYERIVFVVPTIALIDETRRRIMSKFSNEYQIIHHNSQKIKKRKLIFILTQERVNERDDINNIDLFIIDEFYKLAFKSELDERVISLNIALSKLLTVSKQFYMIGPNIDDIRGLEGLSKDYYFIPSEFNTVAVNINEFNIKANDKAKKNNVLKNILKGDSEHLINKGQTIIYCKSPSSAAEISRELIRMGVTEKYATRYTQWVNETYSKEWSYAAAINNGIGIHHGTLPRAVQQKTVDLFNNKKIQFLVCTSTIIEGVNTVAENVIIYDNRNGIYSIDRFTHNNIKGRAGRMKVHFVGNVFCLEETPKQTLASKTVDVPLGLLTLDSPYNLLAGIQPEHIDQKVRNNFEEYKRRSNYPSSLLSDHPTFKAEVLESAWSYIKDLPKQDFKLLCQKGFPDAKTMKLLSKLLKLIASPSLSKCNLHFEESDELGIRLSKYIYAESHQEYLSDRIDWLQNNSPGKISISDGIDRELKIIRNIFGFTVPKVLFLIEDIVNLVCEEKGKELTADFGAIATILENNHLPSNFSALEEMGIPIQTLAKLVTERLSNCEFNTLTKYIRLYFKVSKKLSKIDKLFIKQALY